MENVQCCSLAASILNEYVLANVHIYMYMLTPPTQHQIVAQINEVRPSLRVEGLVCQTKFDLAGSHFSSRSSLP